MKIDHIALQVENPNSTAEWYRDNFDAEILYADDTWSFIQFENIKMAFVVKNQHPAHIAFIIGEFEEDDKVKEHRDGSESVYKRDPFGNIYELIKYK
tara:strand:+ start:160 stop:450 length:291 start_codon:yes stop_codon:yes gene_type:complete